MALGKFFCPWLLYRCSVYDYYWHFLDVSVTYRVCTHHLRQVSIVSWLLMHRWYTGNPSASFEHADYNTAHMCCDLLSRVRA